MSASESDFGVEVSKGVLARFLMAAIGFAGSVVFARVLGPSGYGAFYVVVALVNVLNNPITGWAQACKKRLSESEFPTSEAFGSSLVAAALAPIVIIPTAYLIHQTTSLYDLSGLFLPFAAFFVALSFFDVGSLILSGRSNFSESYIADTLRSLLTTPLQLAFVLTGWGVAGMVYGITIATVLATPYVLWKIGVPPRLPTRRSLLSIAEYGKFSIPNGFILTAKSRIDILLLGGLLTSAAVGQYQVAMQLTIPGRFIGSVSSAGLMARVSDHLSRGNRRVATDDLNNSLGYAGLVSVPIFFGAIAMPNDLMVTIFGPEFAGIGLVLAGLALFRVINGQAMQIGSAIEGLDRPDVGTRIGLYTLVINVGLGFVLLLEYGVLGVVAATIISSLVQLVAQVSVVRREIPELNVLARPFRRQVLAGLVMFIVVDRLHTLVGVAWWADLMGLVGLGAFIYFGTLTIISTEFRGTVQSILEDAGFSR